MAGPRFAFLSRGQARARRGGGGLARQAEKRSLAQLPSEPAREGELPAIIIRAQDEARSRYALQRLGYGKVRAEYARHRQAGRATFAAIAHEKVWPPMDFVRDWLKGERRRILARIRTTFVAAMLITIVGGVAFLVVLSILNWRA